MWLRLLEALRVNRFTTCYLFQDEYNTLYYGETGLSVSTIQSTHLNTLRPSRGLDPDTLFITYDEEWIIADNAEARDVYVKEHRMLVKDWTLFKILATSNILSNEKAKCARYYRGIHIQTFVLTTASFSMTKTVSSGLHTIATHKIYKCSLQMVRRLMLTTL